MTNAQIRLIKFAQRQLGLDDLMYREILRKIGLVGGHTPSCKDLTNAGFERVMAFFESRGFVHQSRAEGYWQDTAALRERFASRQQVFEIRRLVGEVQRYPLVSLCRRFSDGRTEHESKLNPQEAHQLIEMLKATSRREATHREGIHHATQTHPC